MIPVREKYAAAGVDVSAKDRFIDRIAPMIESTRDDRVLTGLGHFGGCFSARELKNYDDPVLVGCTDGIGTKIKLAIKAGSWGLKNVGIDLVAMCVNDLIAVGAKPLYFLDYYASAELDLDQASAFVEGVTEGCKLAGCPLIGGETAQMPGLYTAPDFDAAGFCTGVVERAGILGPESMDSGLVLLGLQSSGLHSNGFSLVRKHFTEPTRELIAPTRIYVKSILAVKDALGSSLKGVANITGGGIYENVPRILPKNVRAVIKDGSWEIPKVILEVQKAAQMNKKELYATFNGGLGMVIAVEESAKAQAMEILTAHGDVVTEIGYTEERGEGGAVVIQGL
jgi:phosphoribosylformylglycinamidine cyclo-ligase